MHRFDDGQVGRAAWRVRFLVLSVAVLVASLVLAPAASSGGGVLYDQYNNLSTIATSSQNFEPAQDIFDAETADDFTVPGGGWTVGRVDVAGLYFNGPGPASTANVRFYANNAASNLPGTLVAERLNQAIQFAPGNDDFVIQLSSSVALPAGVHWVGVQANQNFTPAGGAGSTAPSSPETARPGSTHRTATNRRAVRTGAGGRHVWVFRAAVPTRCSRSTSPACHRHLLHHLRRPRPRPRHLRRHRRHQARTTRSRRKLGRRSCPARPTSAASATTAWST
jgi:hypothetical protein